MLFYFKVTCFGILKYIDYLRYIVFFLIIYYCSLRGLRPSGQKRATVSTAVVGLTRGMKYLNSLAEKGGRKCLLCYLREAKKIYYI